MCSWLICSSQRHRSCADDLLDFGDQRRRRPDADLRRDVGPDAQRASGAAGSSISNDTRRSPRCREKSRRAPRTRRDRPASSGGSPLRAPAARARCRSAAISDARIRTDSSSRSSLPRTSTSVPVSIRLRAALIGLGKRDHLDAALRILEREDRHAIALARLQLTAGGDDAADAGVGLDRLAAARAPRVAARRRRRRVGELGQSSARRTPSAPPRSDRPDGRSSTARASPSRRPAARFRSTARASGSVSAVAVLAPALRRRRRRTPPNSCACPSSRSRWMPRAVLARRVDRRHQPRPQRRRRQRRRAPVSARERIERAGLDQALEHALVDQPQIEILAERVQRRDPALLLRGPRAATRSRLRRRS